MTGRAGRVIREGALWGGASVLVVALHLGGAPILTLDGDFLGCGLPTWTPDTLRMHLGL